ncbi:MAG TPA: enoyl-CoA hydratase/isomerase family protein [Pyrinomonadaceae bacterium]|nr:enoyl-CoA hydratase/isomerase family protein [Pyrinomonadaceae bacterium]
MQDAEQTGHTPSIVVEERRSIIILRLNRPAERNALSMAVLEELDITVSALSRRADISTLIFTGTGEAFASGANIRELHALRPATARDFARRGQRLMQMIADAPQRTIAAVNGYCMGGGLDLALACDLRCAVPAAVFAHPGARLGIITGWGGTQRLPQLIGSARAFEMFLTARLVSGAEALEMGLVNRLGENALDCALEISSNV